MARKGWDQLSSAYRKRLEKSGISKSDYTSGVSLQKARGHKETPEHPWEVKPEKHVRYYAEQQRLINELQEKKRRVFGDSPRWSEQRSMYHIREPRLSNVQLKAALAVPDEEIMDAIRDAPPRFEFFGYH